MNLGSVLNKWVWSLLLLSFLSACHQEAFEFRPGDIHLTQDTVDFDTLLTNRFSAVHSFTIHNPSAENIHLKGIEILPDNADIKLNISGKEFPIEASQKIEILAHDSIVILVQMKLHGSESNVTHLQSHSHILFTGTKITQLTLKATGINMQELSGNLNRSELTQGAYAIQGTATLPAGRTLRIAAGASFYMGKNSQLIINGTLQAAGKLDAPIRFLSDKIDGKYGNRNFYRKSKNHWKGIKIQNSNDTKLDYVEVLNADTLLQIDNSQAEIFNTKLLHASTTLSTTKSSLKISNLIAADFLETGLCFTNTNAIIEHATLAKQNGTLNDELIKIVNKTEKVSIRNSILIGNSLNAVTLGENSKIYHSLLENQAFDSRTVKCVAYNASLPLFKNAVKFNYQLDKDSQARGLGLPDFIFDLTNSFKDFNNKFRQLDQQIDAGAFEYQKE